jgi:hypothetical protein
MMFDVTINADYAAKATSRPQSFPQAAVFCQNAERWKISLPPQRWLS